MGSEQNRFPQQERRKRWGGCLGALSCFGAQKGGKRIVPASRIPESNSSAAQPNGPQAVAASNQATTLVPSLLAPPSSPASFTNSALPSTAQSPSCFLSVSANSPGGPSSRMYATGPYAHETQLVSPPVFSTFTTEPSTAPLTPPPELAHLTTPSSPDVPFAQFLTSSVGLTSTEKSNYMAVNDLQATYSLYPESPASSRISPISRNSGDCLSSSFLEREFHPQWDPSVSPRNDKYFRSGSGRLSGHESTGSPIISHDSNFFCPATFAKFYLDHNPPFPHTGGRLSVSKDSDSYSANGNVHQTRHNRSPKHDAEEIEAYRASFGFSADEMITTPQYVEISDVSFTTTPFTANKPTAEDTMEDVPPNKDQKPQKVQTNLMNPSSLQSKWDLVNEGLCLETPDSRNAYEDPKSRRHRGSNTLGNHVVTDEDMFTKVSSSKMSRKYHLGLSSSDAEIDYRRGRSLRQGKGEFV